MWPFSLGPVTSAQDTSLFERQYTCYPVSFAGREALEKGNKILLPPSALNSLARLNVTWPMLFKVSNCALHRETHSGVLEFSAEEGSCYMPYWMMKNLVISEGDLVKVVNTSLPKGTYVKLQPITTDFLDISDHRAVLEHSLRHFAALTVGDNIVVQHNNRCYEIEILECRPGSAISIIETDVQVDFAPPKDYIEPKRPTVAPVSNTQGSSLSSSLTPVTSPSEASSIEATPSSSKQPFSIFGGAGTRLDGRPIPRGSTVTSSGSHVIPHLRQNVSGATTGRMVDDVDVESGAEEEKPWNTKDRLPGGIRTACADYARLVQEGKLPGIVGKSRAPRPNPSLSVSSSPPAAPSSSSGSFVLFGGAGRQVETGSKTG